MNLKTRFRPLLAKKNKYGVPRSFLTPGRSGAVIYAVTLVDHPGIVKIGRSNKWKHRRKTYDNWNLRQGDGVQDCRIFVVTDEFVDLEALERAVLAQMPTGPWRGNEWFNASLDEAAQVIDAVMTAADISFLLEGAPE